MCVALAKLLIEVGRRANLPRPKIKQPAEERGIVEGDVDKAFKGESLVEESSGP